MIYREYKLLVFFINPKDVVVVSVIFYKINGSGGNIDSGSIIFLRDRCSNFDEIDTVFGTVIIMFIYCIIISVKSNDEIVDNLSINISDLTNIIDITESNVSFSIYGHSEGVKVS